MLVLPKTNFCCRGQDIILLSVVFLPAPPPAPPLPASPDGSLDNFAQETRTQRLGGVVELDENCFWFPLTPRRRLRLRCWLASTTSFFSLREDRGGLGRGTMGSRNGAQVFLWRHRANKLCDEIDHLRPPGPPRALGVGVDSCGLCLEGNAGFSVMGVFVLFLFMVWRRSFTELA